MEIIWKCTFHQDQQGTIISIGISCKSHAPRFMFSIYLWFLCITALYIPSSIMTEPPKTTDPHKDHLRGTMIKYRSGSVGHGKQTQEIMRPGKILAQAGKILCRLSHVSDSSSQPAAPWLLGLVTAGGLCRQKKAAAATAVSADWLGPSTTLFPLGSSTPAIGRRWNKDKIS